MKKTTLYLPAELKEAVEQAARSGKRSEADVIRDAIAAAVLARPPRPRLPLTSRPLGKPRAAEQVDKLLERFGRE